MLNRRLLHSRKASLFVTGVSTACLMLAYEATKQALHPAIALWTSHFVTIAFTTALAVPLRFVLQQHEERSRRELNAESRDRQRAEAELRRSEDCMGMAVEAARIGFFDWDTVRDEQVWSNTAKQLLGLDPESPADLTVLMQAVHAEDRASLRSSEAGAISHYVAIKQDITQRKLAEQALQDAEQKYRGIFENAVLGIFQSTLEGKFLSVNPALSQAAGYDSPQDFLNSVPRVSDVYVDPKRPEELRQLLVAQKVVRDFEAELRSKNGSTRTVSMNVRVVADPRSSNFYLDGTIQDVTPRKLAEQALRKAEQKYRSIFENAVLGIFQTNLEGDFLSVNPALARLAGYDSPEDFLNSVHGAAEIYVDLKRRDELRGLLHAQRGVRDFEVEFTTK